MNALYGILYFKQMNKINTHVSFVLDQTKFRENEWQVVTVYQTGRKGGIQKQSDLRPIDI